MALMSILTGALGLGGGPKRTNIEDSTGKSVILVDATIKEDPNYEAEVTLHPVEDGKDVTDHIHIKNDKLTIEGVVSQSPLNLQSQVKGLISSATGALGSAIGGQIGTIAGAVGGSIIGAALFGDTDNPAKVAHDALLNLLETSEILTITTKTRVYENMVMTNLSMPVDTTTGQALKFTATFQEIRIVTADLISLPSVASSVLSGASGKKKLGKQGAKKSGGAESLLHGLKSGNLFKAGGF
jgi:hypothetical protein